MLCTVSHRCPTIRIFNTYNIFAGEYIICIYFLTVVCLSENVHGFYSYYHRLTATGSNVGVAPVVTTCKCCIVIFSVAIFSHYRNMFSVQSVHAFVFALIESY